MSATVQALISVEEKASAANRSELARSMNLTRSYVSQVLSGRDMPSLPVAVRMARELGITTDELYQYLTEQSLARTN